MKILKHMNIGFLHCTKYNITTLCIHRIEMIGDDKIKIIQYFMDFNKWIK